MAIKTEKTKKYGAIYGYYNKQIEDRLNNEFETKIARITKQINSFQKNKITNIKFTEEQLEDIYSFFDITCYRSKSVLKEVNKESITSKIAGELSHNYLLEVALNSNLGHIYKDLKFNFIINRTSTDFVINDNMISDIKINNGNHITILPINKKESFALMNEKIYDTFFIGKELYYMNIEDEKDIQSINESIFRQAQKNSENVIGTRKELDRLLEKEKI